jgi:phosphotriesterase-related protein
VLVDFIGADQVSPDRYDHDQAYRVIVPHLERVRQLGCRSLIECTPAYLGRNVRLLRRLSEATGVRIVTNTGYYAAGGGKFLPPHATQESAEALARRWLAEWKDGIDGTDIRPGFIKIGVDAGPLNDVSRRLVHAAALTHLESGLSIAAHTGDGRAALEQLEILKQTGVAPSAWIWVHAQNERDLELHRQAAGRGAWISLDGISENSIEPHLEMVQALRRGGLLSQVLISQDAGWYRVGEPGGGTFRSFETLFTRFLPALRQAEFSQDEIGQLTVANPSRAFSLAAGRR